ncbi:hypothetical protein CC78DRAFT_537037 [Lojkania enalia]|uniref:Uncharacterized protein n=1 Tax=Lojkania enalia TaxID=147567 RepID=A0A9P4N286_9PLEO|nr:hypothetical protein CC78DRAFT_537037 [Didymosphaeria enalia]
MDMEFFDAFPEFNTRHFHSTQHCNVISPFHSEYDLNPVIFAHLLPSSRTDSTEFSLAPSPVVSSTEHSTASLRTVSGSPIDSFQSDSSDFLYLDTYIPASLGNDEFSAGSVPQSVREQDSDDSDFFIMSEKHDNTCESPQPVTYDHAQAIAPSDESGSSTPEDKHPCTYCGESFDKLYQRK